MLSIRGRRFCGSRQRFTSAHQFDRDLRKFLKSTFRWNFHERQAESEEYGDKYNYIRMERTDGILPMTFHARYPRYRFNRA
jgi:hypothetical protein